MRAASSAISLTAHAALVVAAVLGTVDARPTDPGRPREVTVLLQPRTENPAPTAPPGPIISGTIVIPTVPIPAIAPVGITQPSQPVLTVSPGGVPSLTGPQDVWEVPLVEEAPEILAGPVPVYPELLRQAGIQGRVVLEVVVDTGGQVEPGSLTVVSATHPGFVAPSRQVLSATLFRPARVYGRAVRVRVRVPIDFTLRGGTGRAR